MKRFFLCCFLSVILLPHAAQGMVIRQASLKEIVELCTDACVGVVDRLEAERDPATGMIYTLVGITVEECVLGAVQDAELTVKTLGGEVGDIGLSVPGMPLFEEGEEVLLFLVDDGEGSYRVISGAMGKYTITEDPLTGEKTASNSTEGIHIIEESIGGEGVQALEHAREEGSVDGPLPRRISLDVLLNLIDEANWR